MCLPNKCNIDFVHPMNQCCQADKQTCALIGILNSCTYQEVEQYECTTDLECPNGYVCVTQDNDSKKMMCERERRVDSMWMGTIVTICIVFFGWAGCCLKCLASYEGASAGGNNKKEFDINYDTDIKIKKIAKRG